MGDTTFRLLSFLVFRLATLLRTGLGENDALGDARETLEEPNTFFATLLMEGLGDNGALGDGCETLGEVIAFFATLLMAGLRDNDALGDGCETIGEANTFFATLLLEDLGDNDALGDVNESLGEAITFLTDALGGAVLMSLFLPPLKPPEKSGDDNGFCTRDFSFKEKACFGDAIFSFELDLTGLEDASVFAEADSSCILNFWDSDRRLLEVGEGLSLDADMFFIP